MQLSELLANPVVQAGVAPFVAGLAAALLLHRTPYGGLAVAAAFFTAVYLVAGFTLTPLSATRKIFLAGLVAAPLGIVLDTVRPRGRLAVPAVIAAAAAGYALWTFWPVLTQKEAAWQLGAAVVVSMAFLVIFTHAVLSGDGVRAGSATLGLGLGVGVASILAASATYGTYGIALGAGAGAFLLIQMIRGKKSAAGATLALPAMLLAGLLAAGAMLLAQLPLRSLLVLSLVPLGALIPLPARAPVWLQAVLQSLAAFIIAAIACYLAWHA